MMRRNRTAALAAALMLALALAAPASAQVFTGRIDVSIEDPAGARVPGAKVDLLGAAAQTQITDAQGQAHFLNLPVGVYTVQVSMPGFAASTSSNVEVLSGASTPLAVKLAVAGTEANVNVTAVTSVVDIRRATTTTHVTQQELQDIPELAQSVGGDADRADRLHGPRQRRGRGRGSSPTTTPKARRRRTTPGASTACP